MADGSWTVQVGRKDLADVEVVRAATPSVEPGEVLLRVDKVGVTANNVTYGVLGDDLRYWNFFPGDEGRGIVPVWGFAEVVDSAADGVAVGSRIYGYLPMASHLVVRPERVTAGGFVDGTAHRQDLPPAYNRYTLASGDDEDLQVLYRPLFYTSFLLADLLSEAEFDVVVVSSASSKTAYGTAFLLQEAGIRVVGLTSPRNVAFTESLGCYDTVAAYSTAALKPQRTVYLDFAGDGDVRAAVRKQLGENLVRDIVIGLTHQVRSAGGGEFFFAPDQMRKRIGDWGADGLERRFSDAWQRFAARAVDWVDVVAHHGPDELAQVWLEVLAGRAEPRSGHVVTC
ncbi:hypothetical protein Lesp02_74370 [Lentzea sp. NBRC 105346]|uniref:DUF2855 family protein n=1 Tax=Lentzea sp. NBRC 105346 TaxID=3032205 RepID=UPI0024A49D85|nr:DUF2855 family protein [Lentzea sp. NBRC 105346]GLZ35250.1 hypothetical protein Lesp02_74370 [Lentzea sp. NBRC 105346]